MRTAVFFLLALSLLTPAVSPDAVAQTENAAAADDATAAATAAAGQGEKEYFLYAEAYYNNGDFEKSRQCLQPVLKSSDTMLRATACRLLAMCYLQEGDIEGAENAVKDLLDANPYFSPSYTDHPFLVELLERNRRHGATIVTASQQAESLEESPVPVTLITSEMLRDIGARTLKEALVAYVPGMTDVASNDEQNIAMRGIYSSYQEKILILLNGHRLNSYSTNTATPDFSISLEKVKQIEVLRGPASSIYGGVALTAVVNIITKDGADVNGLKVKAGAGNYGQVRGDILFGKTFRSVDLMAWASIYNADGQKRHLGGTAEEQPYSIFPVEGDVRIGGYNRRPSYDMGVSLGYDKFSLLYSRRFSKTVSPMSLSIGFTPYSYGSYRTWNGNAPGNAVSSQHAELAYADSHKKLSWQLKAFYDSQWQQRYQIAGDTIADLGDLTNIYVNGLPGAYVRMDRGGMQAISWDEHTYGFKAQASYDYTLGKLGKGTLLIGGEFNSFALDDAQYMEGKDYVLPITTYRPVPSNDEAQEHDKYLLTGRENAADAFVQIKQRLGGHFVVNMGGRYDWKERRSGKTVTELSPRFAVIYNHRRFNLKASYSHSFVDAPYFYRSNNLDVEYGSEDLEPEQLNSLQLSFLSDGKLLKGLFIDAGIYYNVADNVILFDFTRSSAYNAAKKKFLGFELLSRYTAGRFSSELNMTVQKLLSGEGDYSTYFKLYNIPACQLNAIVACEVAKGLKLHANANFMSGMQTTFIDYMAADEKEMLRLLDVPSRFLLNVGASWQWKRLEADFNVNNVLNYTYRLGGSCVAPLPQQGLWFMGCVAYKF